VLYIFIIFFGKSILSLVLQRAYLLVLRPFLRIKNKYILDIGINIIILLYIFYIGTANSHAIVVQVAICTSLDTPMAV